MPAGNTTTTLRPTLIVEPFDYFLVDIATGRTVAEITGIDVTYTLVELATGKVVVNDTSFSRVSSDVPGLQQRFARARAQRDAENRAAGVVADEIKTRLASYMVART